MIALVDCNNFYASCERIFRPDLNTKPVIVLSNNDGCVIARSNEVKDMGVSMGTPLFKINDLVRNYKINIFSSNFALYGDISNRIMRILKNDISNVEIYSIDEAFLDFSNFDNHEAISLDLVRKINKWTGIPTSIGIAENKTLAKIANLFAKQSNSKNIFCIDNSKINFFIQRIKISDVWGIGRKYTKFLNKNKIYTAYDLTQKNDNWILNNMSINGLKTMYELKGIKCFELELFSSPKKNIRTSRTFSKETSDYYKLQRVISSFASKSSEKLRKQNSKTSSISVFIKTNQFKNSNNNFKLLSKSNFEYPTNDSSIIVKEALAILNKIFIPGKLYKQAGVTIGDFQFAGKFQPGLFENISKENKRNKLMQTFDNINTVFGSESIKLGSEEFHNKWRTKRNKLSPSYTTKWNDILDVNI